MDDHEGQAVEGRTYDAFISYSHHADGVLAPQLERALQRLAKPWLRRRAMHVFRDDTGMSYEPALAAAIDRELDRSAWFVLLASPDAAASPWVDHELRHWIDGGRADRLIAVVTDGTWVWDDARGDFEVASTAVPAALRGRFRAEPRHVDMSWTRGRDDLTLRNGQFRDKVAEIAAPIRGKEKPDLVGEDLRLQRRRVQALVAVVAVLVVLTVAALLAAGLAVRAQRTAGRERDRAEAQTVLAETAARQATSRALAARATASRSNRVDERALLAAQAWAVEPTDDARTALISALAATRHTSRYVHGQLFEVATLALSPDGAWLAVADARGIVTLTELHTGEVVDVGLAPTVVRDLLFLDDDTLAAVGTPEVSLVQVGTGEVDVVDGLDGARVVALDRRGHAVVSDDGGSGDSAISGSLRLSSGVASGRVVDLATGEATPFTTPGGWGSVVRAGAGQVLLVRTTSGDPADGREPVALSAYDPVTDDVVVGIETDLPHGDPLTSPERVHAGPLAVAVDLEAGLIAVAGRGEAQLVPLRGGAATAVTPPAEGGRITRVALADGGLVVGTLDGSTFVHDVDAGTTVDAGGILGMVRATSWASGTSLVAVGGQDDAVQIVDVAGASMGTTLPVTLSACDGDCLALSDDGRAAVVTEDGAATGAVDGSGWETTTPDAVSVALGPEEALLAAGTTRGTVEVTDLAGGARPRDFAVSAPPGSGADDHVRSVAISPDGSLLAADAATVDLASGAVADVGSYPELLDLHFAEDGRLLLGSTDETAPVDLDGDRDTDAMRPEDRDPELTGLVDGDAIIVRDLAAPPEAVALCDAPVSPDGTGSDMRDCGMSSTGSPRTGHGDGSTTAVWSSAAETPGVPYNALTFDRRGGVLLVSDVGVVVHAPVEELRSGAQVIGAPDERIVLGTEDIMAARSLAGGLVVAAVTPTGARLFDAGVGTDLGAVALDAPDGSAFGFAAAPDGESFVVGQVGRAPVVVDLDPATLVDRLCAMARRDLAPSVRETLDLAAGTPRGCPDQAEADDGTLGPGVAGDAAETDDPPADSPDPTTTEASPDDAPEWATVEELLVARFAPAPGLYAGPCETASAGVATEELLCSSVRRQDEEEAVVEIGIVASEIIEYIRLTSDGSGWVEAESYSASSDLVNEDPNLPDWVGEE